VRVVPTGLPGVIVIEPDVYHDVRGYFLETYHADRYRAAGIEGPFVQDNHSRSMSGTLRGLHLQTERPQGKLIRVIEGEVFDVAVDVRRGSPTFGRWVSVWISAENFRQCYIPPGFAHGFCVTSDVAQVEYKCTSVYNPTAEVGIAWDDPTLHIAWPIAAPILSERDRTHPTLDRLLDKLPAWRVVEQAITEL
jgi:dTDP-4-dehydrorhamnose 3,5-epimerase